MTLLTLTEAKEACAVLFGPHVKPSLDFFRYLQPSGLKAAYRKKAFETHPDRAGARGEDAVKMAALFEEATTAYHDLLPVIRSNGAALSCGTADSKRKQDAVVSEKRQPKNDLNHFYDGSIPRRNLLIGQYLYYSGMISWKTLIDAVVWQRRQRPMIGQIALKWNKLSEREIQRILKKRRIGERFGECAARAGFLTRFEVMTLVGWQSRRQCPIGEFFLRQNLLRVREMEHMVKRQQVHNRRISFELRP